VTEQRPPVDFDTQKAADRIAELIAEGSILARGLTERFARRREDLGSHAPVEEAPAPGADSWAAACDPPTATTDTAADNGATDDAGAAAPPADSVESAPDGPQPVLDDPADDIDALTQALRAGVARRLGVPASRVRITVALDDAPVAAPSDASAQPAASVVVDGVVIPTPLISGERDPIDALTATLDDLAGRARKRLAEELGVRLPDIIAEIRFPAGGRPSVRIRPSARAGASADTGASAPGGPSTPDLEAILRRLLLGRDARP
jgi:hypothetical protein